MILTYRNERVPSDRVPGGARTLAAMRIRQNMPQQKYALVLPRLDYVDDDNTHLHAETIKVMDHFDACDHGWSHMPETAADFQATEVTA